jgi:hypothetical protein
MFEFMCCMREFGRGILLIIFFGCFVEIAVVEVLKVSSIGVVSIVAWCKVGDRFNWQQGRVGVGKSSHGGVGVCALSGLSLSVGNTNVGFVFASSTGVVSVSKRWGLFSKGVLSDCSIGDVFRLMLDWCVV